MQGLYEIHVCRMSLRTLAIVEKRERSDLVVVVGKVVVGKVVVVPGCGGQGGKM